MQFDVIVSEMGFTLAEMYIVRDGQRLSYGYIVYTTSGVLVSGVSFEEAKRVFEHAIQEGINNSLRMQEWEQWREAWLEQQREAEAERDRSLDMGMSR